ncbi:HDOD domain-containing protein [bacterium]|nr:HDOD domain-containing protein [bacterium]
MERDDILYALMNVEDFPTLPQVVMQVISVCEDEKSDANDLARIVSHDQSISSRILKLSNSAYYGYLKKVNTISKAVTILGFDTIKSLAISASVFDMFKKIKSNYNFDRVQYWIHSIGVASISRMIGRTLNQSRQQLEVIFMGGLLHDIGKLFFESYYLSKYEDVMKEITVNRCTILEGELKVFGVGHPEVGGRLTERWHFPDDLIAAIMYHHDLKSCPAELRQLTCIVHVADHLCRAHNIGSGGDSMPHPIDPLALETLGIPDTGVADLSDRVPDLKEQIFTFLTIMD